MYNVTTHHLPVLIINITRCAHEAMQTPALCVRHGHFTAQARVSYSRGHSDSPWPRSRGTEARPHSKGEGRQKWRHSSLLGSLFFPSVHIPAARQIEVVGHRFDESWSARDAPTERPRRTPLPRESGLASCRHLTCAR